MSRNYKFHNSEAAYFVSFAVLEWIYVFKTHEYRDIFLESLSFCQQNKGMEIFVWCIMTNHVHLVFRSAGERKPEDLLGDLRRFTSKGIIKAIIDNPNESRMEWLLEQFKQAAAQTSNVNKCQFWRHDNKSIELWSNKVMAQKINYIHKNPVKEGLVYRPKDYIYIRARDYSGVKGLLNDVIVVEF